VPGWLALGAPYGGEVMNASEAWSIARELLDTCVSLYTASDTGLGPERVSFHTLASREAARSEARQRAALDERAARKRGGGSHGGGGAGGGGGEDSWRSAMMLGLLSENEDYEVLDAQWPLRPELLESLYIMAALEPEPDRAAECRRRGLAILEAIEVHCRTAAAYSGIRGDARPGRPRHTDILESFFLAETLKYLYLLFAAPEALPLDLRAHVFTTEAHILPVAPLDAAWDAMASVEGQREGPEEDSTRGKPTYPPWWS